MRTLTPLPAPRAQFEVRVGERALLRCGLAVDDCRQHLAEIVALHTCESREQRVWFPSTIRVLSLLFRRMDRATRLALAARDGDRDAMSLLVHSTYEPVWRYCAATAGPAEADDIAQETFERALGSLAGYRGDAPVTTWLIGIARHVYLDRVRRRGRADVTASATPPDVVALDASGRVDLADMIARLGDDRREAFVLTQVMGFRYEEAAEICGCALGTIRSRVARARADLMAMLDERPQRSASY